MDVFIQCLKLAYDNSTDCRNGLFCFSCGRMSLCFLHIIVGEDWEMFFLFFWRAQAFYIKRSYFMSVRSAYTSFFKLSSVILGIFWKSVKLLILLQFPFQKV